MLTFSLQFKDKNTLKVFFDGYKDNLQERGWTLTPIKDISTTKSFLEYKQYNIHNCITKKDITSIFYVSIGIFKTYIKVLDIGLADLGFDKNKNGLVSVKPTENEIRELISFFIHQTINPIQQKELIQNKELLIQYDFVQNLADIRMARPIFYKEIKSNKIMGLKRLSTNKIGNKYLNFATPNNISLLLNISKKELANAKKIYKIIEGKLTDSKTEYCKDDEIIEIYNYLESINISAIFAYSAIEAFSNTSIPIDFEYATINNKGVKELWNKENIERYFKTSEKIDKLLPEILKTEALGSQIRVRFLELEKIRNEIIHPKHDDKIIADLQKKLLNRNIFDYIYSAYELIEFFCNADTKHIYFPIGISNSDIKIIEVQDFSESFKKFS